MVTEYSNQKVNKESHWSKGRQPVREISCTVFQYMILWS